MDTRVYVVKKESFRVESIALKNELAERLELKKLENVLIYNTYDIFGAEETDIKKLKEDILSEKVTDETFDSLDLEGKTYIAFENLPGQYDQRADSAMQCLMLLDGSDDVKISSGRIVVLEGDLSEGDIEKIKKYLINPVENREKDLSILATEQVPEVKAVKIFEGFRDLNEEEIKDFHKSMSFAMSVKDLIYIQEYFKDEEKRDPSETELKVLDTYWSDHCRHTTFETALKNIEIKDGRFKKEIRQAFEKYLKLRILTNRQEKEISLMDMATIVGRYFRQIDLLNDQEVTDEINACSVEIEVEEDGVKKPWLLMFKNETHNHPTEIEPFGGASTCIGGAIRDPLSGRSYVYQALRISGAGDITKPLKETLDNKLPQALISKNAANGYSSYGNQIGLASTYVREFYHPGFVAKRMELGAVVGAAPKENVRREAPQAGDLVLLIGGKTGRDGIGGATGSSVQHTDKSLTTSSSEVQKGNAPMERRIQRLFRNKDFTRLIKKSNDFGAGGVSVAIGELADGLDIYLDNVPVKYQGLNGTELAISESQERMAIVIDKQDLELAKEFCDKENLDVVLAATVTDTGRLVMDFMGQRVVDLSRAFLNTNGVRQEQEVSIVSEELTENPFEKNKDLEVNKENILANLKNLNTAMQKGMIEKFDASVGRSTVLWPFGGKYQLTEEEASVQKLPTTKYTNTSSCMAVGYNPHIASYSPYLGAAYSVVEALAKLVAVGANYKKARLTNQEYFEKLLKDKERWGKPAQALLGLISAQLAFKTPSIGGKDSMSGSFNELNVPPTLVTFAINTEDARNIISAEFKEKSSYIYLVKIDMEENYEPNYEKIKENFDRLRKDILDKKVISAGLVKFGGIAEIVSKMSFGNKIGFELDTDEKLFTIMPGSVVVEAKEKLEGAAYKLIGKTNESHIASFAKGVEIEIEKLIEESLSLFKFIYPTAIESDLKPIDTPIYTATNKVKPSILCPKPRVIIPVFPGSNSEYDTKKAFEKAGAQVELFVLNNLDKTKLMDSMKILAGKIKDSQIVSLVGGFSLGDEPDGSGKFIANVLRNEYVREAVYQMLDKDGLMLGICNGFQALIKSGLLPYKDMDMLTETSPTLFRNNINRHVSKVVKTRITSNKSPWLSSFTPKDLFSIIVSHGEGKFVGTEEEIKNLFENGQVACQYTDLEGNPSMNGEYNPNSSMYAIEAITSLDGRILGKMGHSERYEDELLKNIEGNKFQDIFTNGINYFK